METLWMRGELADFGQRSIGDLARGLAPATVYRERRHRRDAIFRLAQGLQCLLHSEPKGADDSRGYDRDAGSF